MTNIAYHSSKLERWVESTVRMGNGVVWGSDFDQTLSPRFADDERLYDFMAGEGRGRLAPALNRDNLIVGICSARAILEAASFMSLGLVNQKNESVSGFGAAENGAVVFCPRISQRFEERLITAGFKLEHQANLTILNLARYSPAELRDRVVLPSIRASGLADDQWSSSVGENHIPENFRRLFEMSRHSTPKRTHDACVRYGSAYVKIYHSEDGNHEKVIQEFRDRCADLHAACLVTPPVEGCPIWSIDISGGATKYDALNAISRAYCALLQCREEDFPMIFTGDGENDVPAFEYICQRPGTSNRAFLVDTPKGNSALAAGCPAGTTFLEGRLNLDGVLTALDLYFKPPA